MTSLQTVVFGVLWILVATLGTLVLLLYRQVERAYRKGPDLGGAHLAPGTKAPSLEVLREDGRLGPLELPPGDLHFLAFIDSSCGGCRRLVEALAAGAAGAYRVTLLLTEGPGFPEYRRKLPANVVTYP